jgi:hypothetical protein
MLGAFFCGLTLGGRHGEARSMPAAAAIRTHPAIPLPRQNRSKPTGRQSTRHTYLISTQQQKKSATSQTASQRIKLPQTHQESNMPQMIACQFITMSLK